MQVLRAARKLNVYTIQICKNENVFPKSQRWIMSQRIANEALDVLTCIRRANAARADKPSEKEYRAAQQMEAKCHLEALLSLIDLAYEVFGIETKKIDFWTNLADETLGLLDRWRRSEK